jgi:hypothetical protein
MFYILYNIIVFLVISIVLHNELFMGLSPLSLHWMKEEGVTRKVVR